MTRALASPDNGVEADGVGIGGEDEGAAVAFLDVSSLGLRPRGVFEEGDGASSDIDVGGASGFSSGIGWGS